MIMVKGWRGGGFPPLNGSTHKISIYVSAGQQQNGLSCKGRWVALGVATSPPLHPLIAHLTVLTDLTLSGVSEQVPEPIKRLPKWAADAYDREN